jgi:hypothetical protein
MSVNLKKDCSHRIEDNGECPYEGWKGGLKTNLVYVKTRVRLSRCQIQMG